MMEDQLKAFLEAIQVDAVLQEKLKEAQSPEAVVAIAKEAGFLISAEALQMLKAEKELSDEEVADVTGGRKVGGEMALRFYNLMMSERYNPRYNPFA